MKDTSQYGEGAFIASHFVGRFGNFLDIGAFDGKTFSNTWPLYLAGWGGVCVEPSPIAFGYLMQTYADSKDVRLVNCALSGFPAHGDSLTIFQANAVLENEVHHARMMSSLKREHAAKFPEEVFREIYVASISWKTLLEGLGIITFDFVNIDVEGCNVDVFDSMPIYPEMVCVEADPPETVEAMVKSRYANVKHIGGNILGWK